MAKDSVKAIPIVSFPANALLPAVWQEATPAGGLPEACFTLIFRNHSNRGVVVSYNGADIHDIVNADSVTQIDFQTNSSPNGFVALIPKGTHIYYQGAIGGAGDIYISGYYQEEL